MANTNKTVDFAALDLLCDKLECGGANHRATAAQIRKAMNGVERSNDGVDVDALLELADEIEDEADLVADEMQEGWANTMRKAVKGVPSWSSLKGVLSVDKPQLPEGIEWPRFEDGELVKFGDEFETPLSTVKVLDIRFARNCMWFVDDDGRAYSHYYGDPVKRPEPEVLDADGVPIKVGDTVYAPGYFESALKVERFDAAMKMVVIFSEESLSCGFRGDQLTHRKPDTRESVKAEIVEAVKADYAVNLLPLFDRYEAAVLRELGGE